MSDRSMNLMSLNGFLLLLVISGCGYRFPADRIATQEHNRWEKTVLTVEGVKNELHADTLLTRMLNELLTTRMGPFAQARSATDPKRLRIRLNAVNRELILEDKSGRANQYRITLTAQPIQEQDGKPAEPAYPQAKGVATYYEPSSGTASRAARMRAETEALHQLADALVALLAEDLQPGKQP
ncbi:MAG: hypothetical protein HQM01_13495 [Magnetococcales bacterium]|nr:hypothetical protein [Magnetococcales bacterium]